MKRKSSILSILALCMALCFSTTSCKDMMTPDSERQSYVVAQDTLYSYWGIVRSLQNIAEKYVILNECRGDLVNGSDFVSDSIKAILNFGMNTDEQKYYKDGVNEYLNVRDFYHVINSCNAYIASCDKERKTGIGRNPYMLKEYAQVLSIRAWVYMQLVNAYGKVPFYTQPMLTTDEINDFMNEGNTCWITAEELADELAPELEEMYEVEYEFGYPQYNYYGGMVHSSKLMFPTAIVLGDLYLMKGGSQATYAKAAQWYFKFIDYKYGGPINDLGYYCTGRNELNSDKPLYDVGQSPFSESGMVSRYSEAITLIPSNYSKLNGKVNTDICRLFGFTPTIRVVHIKNDYDDTDGSDNEDSEVAYVSLTREYERELIPSQAYEQLCDSQKYEVYLGTSEEPYRELITLADVGDARRAWTLDIRGVNWTFYIGEDEAYGKMVHKQCPFGGFSGLYPLVYRKATVWLRYAEALNRAGFPTYAFAVLKTGLCNNSVWFPEYNDESDELTYWKLGTENTFEYEPVDTAYIYCLEYPVENSEGEITSKVDTVSLDSVGNIITDLEVLEKSVYAKYDYINESIGATETDDNYIVPEFLTDNVYCHATGFQQWTNQSVMKMCYYISRDELKDAKTTPYLNFDSQYLYGNNSRKTYCWQDKEVGGSRTYTTFNAFSGLSSTDRFTMGIHSRGCGLTLPLRDELTKSSYEYEDMVSKKIKENTGLVYTKEDIYNGRYDENVINAVEDLIVDEMGLELSFEGTRFTDLSRIAKRRGESDYLAKRVAKRSGKEDATLRTWLQNTSHWYLPLPKE